MRSLKRAIGYGVILWAVPFTLAVMIYPLKKNGSSLFETIMSVTVTACALWLAGRYFREGRTGQAWEGLKVGLLWAAISLAIDLPMFSWGPMARPIWDYLTDIGLAYTVYPVITTWVAVISSRTCMPAAGRESTS